MTFKLPLLTLLICFAAHALSAQSYTKMLTENATSLALATGGFVAPTLISYYKTKNTKNAPSSFFKHLPCVLAGAGAYWYAPLASFKSNDLAKFYGVWAGSAFFADMALKKLVYPKRPAKKLATRAFFHALTLPAYGIATAAVVNYVLNS